MMLYRVKLICSVFLLSTIYSAILPQQAPSDQPLEQRSPDRSDFDFDSVSFDEEDDYDFMNEYLDTTGMDHISRAIDPVVVITI